MFLGKKDCLKMIFMIGMTFFQNFHLFFEGIFKKWINNYTAKSTLPFMILSEYIWFNSNIKVDSKPLTKT